MTDPVTRVRYFDHQLIRAGDLTLDQAYHRRLRHIQTRLMHRWGIGEGLEVTVTGGGDSVTVAAGVAFDRDGREMVLAEPFTLAVADLQLPASDPAWVTITWAEQEADLSAGEGVAEATRWLEIPLVAGAAAPPADPGHSVILGKILCDGGRATAIDSSDRRLIGLPEAQELRADLARRVARDGAESMTGPLSIDNELRLGAGSRLSGDAAGLLSVSAQSVRIAAPLTVSGSVDIGTAADRRRLTVNGDIAAQRAVVHLGRVDGSTATAGEVLGGLGFWGMGVQHGQLSFRAGSGFELVDRSPDGPGLDYPPGTYQYADLRAGWIRTGGNIIIGSGSNGALQTRHVDGKQAGNDDPDPLHLNWATGLPVHVGGGQPADLHVSGGIFGDGGVLQFGHGAAIRNSGRQHIFTQESLYLLSVDSVHVSNAWGGPGDLFVDGSVYTSGRTVADKPDWSGGGLFVWDLFCLGGAYGKTKSFLIDHPLDPERRHLLHGVIEGPEHGVVYRGEGRLTAGHATVRLPDYFEALARAEGRTVVLTPKSDSDGPIATLAASTVRDGGFTVRAADGAPSGQGFYWEVKAVRADVPPLVVDVPKAGADDRIKAKGGRLAAPIGSRAQ